MLPPLLTRVNPNDVIVYFPNREDHPLLFETIGCPQDPVYHAEGDVYTHTCMVVNELATSAEVQRLSPTDRGILQAAALFHDVGKPKTTVVRDDGRITSIGHSRVGSILTRHEHWKTATPIEKRELICNLVKYHQVPFFMIDEVDPIRTLIKLSYLVDLDLLYLLALGDIYGRTCSSDLKVKVLTNIALFKEMVDENKHNLDPVHGGWKFKNARSRIEYFRSASRNPFYEAYDSKFRCVVSVISGFPGAGKSTFVANNYSDPVVCLDTIRKNLKISPEDNQGAVISEAYEQARKYLRKDKGFVWDATNISRDVRDRVTSLLLNYDAYVNIVALEVKYLELHRRNSSRANPVPESVYNKLFQKWEYPTQLEAHNVEPIST